MAGAIPKAGRRERSKRPSNSVAPSSRSTFFPLVRSKTGRRQSDIHSYRDLPRGERWVEGMQLHNLDVVGKYTDRALSETTSRIDAIIWPENLLTTHFDLNADASREIQRWVNRWETSLITGMVRSPRGSAKDLYRSSVLWIEPRRGLLDSIDKERAMPVVESSRSILPASTASFLFGQAASWPKVEEARNVGTLKGNFEIVPALCFEILFPSLIERRRSAQSTLIVNLSDETWGSGKALSRELVEIATFRAIEQRLTLVRVAHGGVSTVVNPFGEQILELPVNEYAHAVVSVANSAPPQLGERIAIAALPIVTGVTVYCLVGFVAGRRDPDPK